MAAYDNKVLDGAGVAKLSQLIKEEIASSSSGGSGGSGLPVDPVTDGTYKLVNTIETENGTQTATQSWEEDSHVTPYPVFLDSFIGLISGNTYNASNNRSMLIRTEGSFTKDEWKNIFLNNGEAFVQMTAEYAGPVTQAIAELEGVTSSKTYISIMTTSTSLMAAQYTYNMSITTARPLNYWLNANQQYYIAYSPKGFGQNTQAHWLIIRDPYKQIASGYFQSNNGGITATSIGGALDELATTRIPDALVSTETTPSINNTINWLYE